MCQRSWRKVVSTLFRSAAVCSQPVWPFCAAPKRPLTKASQGLFCLTDIFTLATTLLLSLGTLKVSDLWSIWFLSLGKDFCHESLLLPIRQSKCYSKCGCQCSSRQVWIALFSPRGFSLVYKGKITSQIFCVFLLFVSCWTIGVCRGVIELHKWRFVFFLGPPADKLDPFQAGSDGCNNLSTKKGNMKTRQSQGLDRNPGPCLHAHTFF